MLEPSTSSSCPSPVLKTTYKSPTNQSFATSQPMPPPSSTHSVQDKTAYLSSLRHAIFATQENVNKELTARMEEDKAREASEKNRTKKGAAVTNGKKRAYDEAKEEENYGEDDQGMKD
ncbi:hypothetical protein MKZ38_010127 [Zalerion maritima]|uniref:EKC/KEOPS complex subunit GON7 n=1 Tax=Zalerion maritima TaxID=339359 RepID=A0AAD5RG53_9PEZI|nr:hypothetical protein MKZ38_010127 [Zalerion maritima]